MSEKTTLVVNSGAYLTLHYRLATLDGVDIISTFHESPATLLLGQGQLAPFLEQALLGLEDGSHTTQELAPEQAFGMRNPDLVQRVSLKTLRDNSASGEDFKVGDLIDFSAPSGGKFAGVIQELDAESALFDFNHPLAGQRVLFEVKIIGIL